MHEGTAGTHCWLMKKGGEARQKTELERCDLLRDRLTLTLTLTLTLALTLKLERCDLLTLTLTLTLTLALTRTLTLTLILTLSLSLSPGPMRHVAVLTMWLEPEVRARGRVSPRVRDRV